MTCLISKSSTVFTRLQAGVVSLALVLGTAGFAVPASANSITEVTLASSSEASTFCQSGNMPSKDIAYITGGPGLVQYGPAYNCVQQVATKGRITKAIQVAGSTVSECKLASVKRAKRFCESNAMGEWDIDYIFGKVGRTLSGPGYGCTVGYSTSSIGNAICQ